LLARLQPALAIIDINYGHESFTWALLRAVKEDPCTASIPVIACAAAPWLLQHESVFFAHYDVSTWSEPFDLVELLRTLDVALSPSAEGQRPLPASAADRTNPSSGAAAIAATQWRYLCGASKVNNRQNP
jgi:hypothetical protein